MLKTMTLIRLHGSGRLVCPFVVCMQQNEGFSRQVPIITDLTITKQRPSNGKFGLQVSNNIKQNLSHSKCMIIYPVTLCLDSIGLGQVGCLIASLPDLCHLSYFNRDFWGVSGAIKRPLSQWQLPLGFFQYEQRNSNQKVNSMLNQLIYKLTLLFRDILSK